MNIFTQYFYKKNLEKFFDYAAHTPQSCEVISYIEKLLPEYGNPSSIHSLGVKQNKKIEDARTACAHLLSVSPSEIIFTPGGTASINLAIQGILGSFSQKNPDITPHIISSEVEHSAVKQTLLNLFEMEVIELTLLPIGTHGIITAEQVKDAIQENTILITTLYVNNETGAINPIQEIGKEIFKFKKEHSAEFPLFHVDASQAFLPYQIIPRSLHIDLLSFSSAKTYGPAHGGILYAKKGTQLSELLYGGSQEQKLWPGTQSVIDICAGVFSFIEAGKHRKKEMERICELSYYLREQLTTTKFYKNGLLKLSLLARRSLGEVASVTAPGAQSSGWIPLEGGMTTMVSPYIVHGYALGLSSERLLIELDSYGISISAQAACDSEKEGISDNIKALWKAQDNDIYEGERAVFRISLGIYSNKKGINYLVKKMDQIFDKIQLENSLTNN